MDLREIASISGKSGLYKILKPTRNGVILESLDAQKTKIIASASSKVSILKEISMYTTGKVANTPLEQIFVNVKAKHPSGISVDTKTASNAELAAFLKDVLPDYDADKIYASDIKKLINWYNVLIKFAPEIFEKPSADEEVAVEAEASAEVTETKAKKAKKETATKTTKPTAATGSKIKASQNAAPKSASKTMSAKRGS